MCHIVNTNSMILPVKDVCDMAHKHGILVAVDGAQAAGMIRVNLEDLGCDYYAASSHKWMFSPKGVGVFYAKKSAQSFIRPLIVAAGYEENSIRRFENYNTRNLPEVLGLGTSIDFLNLVGQEKIEKRIYQLKHYFLDQIKMKEKLKLKTPNHNQLSGGILTVEIKGRPVREVAAVLDNTYKLNCRPMDMKGLNGLRISLSIYITRRDIDYLFDALDDICG